MKRIEKETSLLAIRHLGSHTRLELFFASVLRFAVCWAATFGLCSLVNAGLLLKSAPTFFGLSFLFTLLFFLLFSSLRGAVFGGSGLLLSLLALSSAVGMSPIKFFGGGGVGLWNRIMFRMASLGYLTAPLGPDRHVTSLGVAAVISLLASLVFVLFLRRKTRALPTVAVFLAVSLPFYISGMLTSMADSTLPLCVLCAVVAMRRSEKRSHEASTSGAVGLTCLLLALAILLSPIGTGGGLPKVYSPLSDRLRAWVNELLQLGEIDLPTVIDPTASPSFDPLSPESKRSAKAYDRIFENKKILTLESDRKEATYLRTWVGGRYVDDAWEAIEYRDMSIAYGEFAAETPSFWLPLDLFRAYASIRGGTSVTQLYASVGYASRRFKIRLQEKTALLPIPIGHDSTPFGGAIYTDSPRFDGFYTDLSQKTNNYYVTARSRVSATDEQLSMLYGMARGYQQYTADRYIASLSSDANRYATELYDRLGKYGLQKERNRRLDYRIFLESAYGEKISDAAIDRAVREILEENDFDRYFDIIVLRNDVHDEELRPEDYVYRLRDETKLEEIAAAVADYLSEHCRYDLTPSSEPSLGAMENFLFESGEGYCVQFATAGALILRRLGFLTRYAEGYVADGFRYSAPSEQYYTEIYDRQAHAWCEVWVDGLGWIVQEMTPGYHEIMPTDPPTDTTDDEPSDTSDEPPVTTTPEDPLTTEPPLPTLPTGTEEFPTTAFPTTSVGGEETSTGQDLRPLYTVLVILLPIGIVILTLCRLEAGRKRRQRALASRVSAIGNASLAERKALGSELTATLFQVLRAYRLTPQQGELPAAFGTRLDKELSNLGLCALPSVAIAAMVSQVYGGAMSAEELQDAHASLLALRERARKRLPLLRYLSFRLRSIL